MNLEEKAKLVRESSEVGILRDVQNAAIKAKVFGLHLLDGFDERIISKIKELDELIDGYLDLKEAKATAEQKAVADAVNNPEGK